MKFFATVTGPQFNNDVAKIFEIIGDTSSGMLGKMEGKGIFTIFTKNAESLQTARSIENLYGSKGFTFNKN